MAIKLRSDRRGLTTWLEMVSLWSLKVGEIMPLMLRPRIQRLFSLCFAKPAPDPGVPPMRGCLDRPGQDTGHSTAQDGDLLGQFFLQSECWCDCGLHDPLLGQKHPPVPLGSMKRKPNIAGGYAKWKTVCQNLKKEGERPVWLINSTSRYISKEMKI